MFEEGANKGGCVWIWIWKWKKLQRENGGEPEISCRWCLSL